MSSTTGFRSRERPHSPPTDAEARRAMERRRAPDAANPLMTAPMRKANYPTAKPTGWDTRSAWRAPGGPARIAGEMLRTEARAEAAGGPARLFADFTWTTRDSSSRARRGGRQGRTGPWRRQLDMFADRVSARTTCQPAAPVVRGDGLCAAPRPAPHRPSPRPASPPPRRKAAPLNPSLQQHRNSPAPNRRHAATPLPAPTTHDKQCSHASPPRRPW